MTPPNFSIYAATKSALDAITRVLAKELGPRQIRVNSINPGATATEGARTAGVIGVGSDSEKQMIAMTPLGRIGQPSDIAPTAVFLASDESGWLTGEIICASGGCASSFQPGVQRICTALRGDRPRGVGEFVRGDGSIRLMFEDGSLQEVLLPERQKE